MVGITGGSKRQVLGDETVVINETYVVWKKLVKALVSLNEMILVKVIPLKLFYYQTFYETWRDLDIRNMQ